MRIWSQVGGLGSLFAAAVSCTGGAAEMAVANAFIDAYYLEFDLRKAQKLCDGPAAIRVAQDLERSNAVRKGHSVEGSRSKVYYGSPDRRVVGEGLLSMTYNLEAHSEGSVTTRQVVVSTARRGDVWRVIAFSEMDARRGAEADFAVRTSTRTTRTSTSRGG